MQCELLCWDTESLNDANFIEIYIQVLLFSDLIKILVPYHICEVS